MLSGSSGYASGGYRTGSFNHYYGQPPLPPPPVSRSAALGPGPGASPSAAAGPGLLLPSPSVAARAEAVTSTPQPSPANTEEFLTPRGGPAARLGERISWEYHNVQLVRVPGYGFGIAVSGGRDNPHFTNGDPSIAISDVIPGGPAEGKLQINDRVITANNNSLEGVDYATAVQVLRDSGQVVSLVIKRRVVVPPTATSVTTATTPLAVASAATVTHGEPHALKVSLSKTRKKDDFGVVLGCRIFVKEISSHSVADKDGGLREGDVIHKINGTHLEGLSLKEARKLLDSAKDRLEIVVKRDNKAAAARKQQYQNVSVKDEATYLNLEDSKPLGAVFPPPTTRPSPDKNRSLGHYAMANGAEPQQRQLFPDDVSDTQSGATIPLTSDDRTNGTIQAATNNTSNHSTPQQDYIQSNGKPAPADAGGVRGLPDPRFISFKKAGSVGIRLTGGNDVGIFVTAVQPGSPAAQQGLQPGDKILKVNDMDMKGVTREEAVLFLLSLQDQINLIAQFRKDEYDQIVALQRGDSFYIKAHFHNDVPEKGELAFKKSDVFQVVDTLHNGVVGAWQVFKMDPLVNGLGHGPEQVQKGIVPNKARAEVVATQQFNAAKKEQSAIEQSKGSFFKRKREKVHRRSKSLGKDHWEDLVWSESLSKFPAYERVSLRHPGFPRPVVIFGPVADLARERLLKDYPGKFASPQQLSGCDDGSKGGSKSGIIRLSAIRDIMDRGKHALLDVTPSAVDKLNYAQFYPIVIFTRTDSKQAIKDCRAGTPKAPPTSTKTTSTTGTLQRDWFSWKSHLSSKKLLEQCQKLDKYWSHIFTSSLDLTSDHWYHKLVDLVDKQQTAPIWMSETKPEESFSDDFLFPMTSRLSYASSPESDGEFCDAETPRASRTHLAADFTTQSGPASPDVYNLPRSTSDPSLARKQEITLPYAVNAAQKDEVRPQMAKGDNNYGFSSHSNPRPANASDSLDGDEISFPPPPPIPQQQQMAAPTSQATVQMGAAKGVSVPPKIDRQKKPSRRSHGAELTSSRSSGNINMINVAANGDGEEAYSLKSSSLDRNAHLRDMKMATYDGSKAFDPYNCVDGAEGGRPRSLVSTTESPAVPHGSRAARATSQDAGYRASSYASQAYPQPESADYQAHYRYAEYKPVPPPKSGGHYKPVPPPKPRSYPRSGAPAQPHNAVEGNYMNSNGYNNQYAASQIQPKSDRLSGPYSMGNYQSTPPNGRLGDEDSNGGFDSGHGSSLDRDYPSTGSGSNGSGRYSKSASNNRNSQYYYNIPPQVVQQQQQAQSMVVESSPRKTGEGLDLSKNREYRGSAFELYRKPASTAASSLQPGGHHAAPPQMQMAQYQHQMAHTQQYLSLQPPPR